MHKFFEIFDNGFLIDSFFHAINAGAVGLRNSRRSQRNGFKKRVHVSFLSKNRALNRCLQTHALTWWYHLGGICSMQATILRLTPATRLFLLMIALFRNRKGTYSKNLDFSIYRFSCRKTHATYYKTIETRIGLAFLLAVFASRGHVC